MAVAVTSQTHLKCQYITVVLVIVGVCTCERTSSHPIAAKGDKRKQREEERRREAAPSPAVCWGQCRGGEGKGGNKHSPLEADSLICEGKESSLFIPSLRSTFPFGHVSAPFP